MSTPKSPDGSSPLDDRESALPEASLDNVDWARSKARTDSSRRAAAGALVRALQDAFDHAGYKVLVDGAAVGPSRKLRGFEARFLMRVEGLGRRSVSAHIPQADVVRDGGFVGAISLVFTTVERMVLRQEIPTPRDLYRRDIEAMGFDPDSLGIPKRGA